MRTWFASLFYRAKATVVDDVRSDPYLKFILVISLMSTAFWFWYRTPNFVAPDEYGRLLRPMKAAGFFVADPSISSFARGATDGLAQGASFYLYALTLIPASLFVLLTGQLAEFASFGVIASRWTLWHAVPAWYWSLTIIVARLLNVVAAVSAVYVLYRLGTEAYDRRAGRLAALVFALSLGLIASAHEANEDTMTVLLLLLVLYLSYKYVRSGSQGLFLLGCGLGGLTIAFKLTGGTVVLLLGAAYLLEAKTEEARFMSALVKPKLVGTGLLLGLFGIYIGMPNVLFGGPSELLKNVLVQTSNKAESGYVNPPTGFFLLRSYLNALGLPLFLAVISSSVIGVGSMFQRPDSQARDLKILVLVPLAIYLLVFGSWAIVKTHHILPTIPLLILLAAQPLRKIRDHGLSGKLLISALIVTTALYAGIGTVQYASDPRDEAAAWIQSEVDAGESMTVYENSVADIGIVHGREVQHYSFVEEVGVTRSVEDESEYTEWMVTTPERAPNYIQLTEQSTSYLDPLRSSGNEYPRRSTYVRSLLIEENEGYDVVAEFGTRPEYPSYGERLLFAGLKPRIEKLEPYVVILERRSGSETQRLTDQES